MIRWYDYLAAFVAADFMTAFVFGAGLFGGFAAYGVYLLWIEVYCSWRRDRENEK